jgi:ParB family chromosome partitioning protein
MDGVTASLEASMGVRSDDSRPGRDRVTATKDAGRRPITNVGRLSIDEVVPDPAKPRIAFAEDALERLAASIRDKGQLTPIRVRWSDDHGRWLIISGERRWRAAKRAGLAEIECYFHEEELTTSEILEQQIIENCLREDLQPVEEARAFASLMKLNGWSGKEVAQALRVHPSRVSRALALMRLPESVQEQVNAGTIPARAAYEISKHTDAGAQQALAERVAAGGLSPQEAARAVRRSRGKARGPRKARKLTFFGEDSWRVTVSAPRKGTYHEVEEALALALEEVRHRIDSGCQLF